MSTQHFRAKYSIEQYPVVFVFPGPVLGIPVVSIKVVSGDDPDKESFAGLPVAHENLVAVLLIGGLPGVVYEISCEASVGGALYTLSGVIAVLSTPAVIPEGTAVIPFTETVTTPPYPYGYTEPVALESFALSGLHKVLIAIYEYLEAVGLSAIALSGLHRPLIASYEYREFVDLESVALPGLHKLLLVMYSYTEPVGLSSVALSGIQRVIMLQYLNYIPEPVGLTSYALPGTHTPI